MSESTPRPTEAEVRELAIDLYAIESDLVELSRPQAIRLARAVLTSDWLAERDAEHEAEMENLVNNWRTHEERGNIQRARAEAAERDLAELCAAVKLLAHCWSDAAGTDRDTESRTLRHVADVLRALLPTEDDA